MTRVTIVEWRFLRYPRSRGRLQNYAVLWNFKRSCGTVYIEFQSPEMALSKFLESCGGPHRPFLFLVLKRWIWKCFSPWIPEVHILLFLPPGKLSRPQGNVHTSLSLSRWDSNLRILKFGVHRIACLLFFKGCRRERIRLLWSVNSRDFVRNITSRRFRVLTFNFWGST